MRIPEKFKMWDDTGVLDDIILYKDDILFIDDDVCLVKTNIDDEIEHILFRMDNFEVLSKEFQFCYITF